MVEAANTDHINFGFIPNWFDTIEKFEDLPLNKLLLRGIYGYGFEKPSLIQQKCILPILKKNDIFVQSPSGMGKTASFAIAMLNLINPINLSPQALVLAPTRESAVGIENLIRNLGKYLNIPSITLIGGTAVKLDKEKLGKTAQIVVGTPVRTCNCFQKGFLDVQNLKIIVFDQIDELLNIGFKDVILEIFKEIPATSQICFFSATNEREIFELSQRFMNEPVQIIIKNEEKTLYGIRQYYILMEKDEWKLDTLGDLLQSLDFQQCIIYCNSQQKVDLVTQFLKDNNILAIAYNDNNSEKEFRNGSARIIVMIENVPIFISFCNFIINFELPLKFRYVHRIGRSGRFGRKGCAINFIVGDNELKDLLEIEKYYDTRIEELPLDISDIL